IRAATGDGAAAAALRGRWAQSRRAHVSCRASARVHGARLGRAAPVRRRRRGPAGRGADGGTRRLPEPLRARRAPGRPARRARSAGGVAAPVRAPRSRARAPRARRDRSRRRVLRARPSHARRREPRRSRADGLREGSWRRPLGRARAVALRRVDLRRSLSVAGRAPRYIPNDGDDRPRLLRTARSRAGRERDGDKARFPTARTRAHPDVSEAPDADERFREVVEAYEVLSKTETRDLYDRY